MNVADMEENNVHYAGPFSQGMLCGTSGSLIEHLIDNNSLGNARIINDLQEGCYCPNQSISNHQEDKS